MSDLHNWLMKRINTEWFSCAARVFVVLMLALPSRLNGQVTSVFWSVVGNAVIPSRASAIESDPRSSTIFFLATPSSGIWKTTNSGNDWALLTEEAATQQYCSLTLDPLNPDNIYAGTGDDQDAQPGQGVLRSTDAGLTWTLSELFSSRPVCALAVDPSNPQRIAAGSAEGLFVSADSGVGWRKVLAAPVTSISFDAQGQLYAGLLGPDTSGPRSGILVRSGNSGESFSNIILPDSSGGEITRTIFVSVVARPGALFLAVSYVVADLSRTAIDVYRSGDGGISWSVARGVGISFPPTRLLADAAGNRLYLVGSSTLLTSPNRGSSWNSILSLQSGFHSGAFSGTSILVAGDSGLERFSLLNADVGLVVPEPPIAQFTSVSATNSGNILAAGPSGLFRYSPSSPSWTTLNAAEGFGTVLAAPDTTGLAVIVLGSANSSVYRSADGGATFTALSVIPATEPRAPFPPMLSDPNNLTTVFVAARNLYRSMDEGATWAFLSTIDPDPNRVVIAITSAPSARRFMYAATGCLPQSMSAVICSGISNIWRSTNSGLSWTQMGPVVGRVNELAVDPRQTQTVYAAIGPFPAGTGSAAGSTTGDLMRSTDNGATWLSVRSNMPRLPLRSVVIDPLSLPQANQPAQTLYAGGDAGVFASFNGGAQWTVLNALLPPSPVVALRLVDNGSLLAASFGRGALLARVAGFTAGPIMSPLSLNLRLRPGGATSTVFSLANVSLTRFDWTLTSSKSWLAASVPQGSLASRAIAEIPVRISTAGLSPGTYFDRMRLIANAGSQTIPVTLLVSNSTTRLSVVSGDNATGVAGSVLPPLVVSLTNADGIPVAGALVNFAITGGSGTLSNRSDLTDSGGFASATLTLPNATGMTQVTASYEDSAVVFTAQSVQNTRPSLQSGGAVNAATFNSGAPLAPGMIISIFGQYLADGDARAATLPLPDRLRSTRVLLGTGAGETAIPLFYVSPLQVNAVLPFDLPPGAYPLRVESAGVMGNEIQVVVAAASPGIFTLDGTGRGPGIFYQADGTLVTTVNAASRGSIISFYAAGLGAVSPPLSAADPGQTAEPLNRTVQQPRVFFDNLEAEVVYSGLAPGFAGLYQINVRVPAGVSPASNIPVSVIIAGAASNRVTVPVQ